MGKRIFKRVKRTPNNRKVGDIVFIHNHHAKSNVRKLGKVVWLFTSNGQNAQAATVKMHNQNPLYQYIDRPVRKLYPLESVLNEPVTQEELDLIPKNIPSDINITDYNDTPERARRIAAVNSTLICRLSEQTYIQGPRKKGSVLQKNVKTRYFLYIVKNLCKIWLLCLILC